MPTPNPIRIATSAQQIADRFCPGRHHVDQLTQIGCNMADSGHDERAVYDAMQASARTIAQKIDQGNQAIDDLITQIHQASQQLDQAQLVG